MEELAYLANVLVAAHSVSGRRLRSVEALELAVATANRGLERTLGAPPPSEKPAAARALLATAALDILFRIGWRR